MKRYKTSGIPIFDKNRLWGKNKSEFQWANKRLTLLKLPSMQYDKLLQNYCIASSTYCTVRKPIAVRNHKILTDRTRYAYKETDKEYRHVLVTETIPLTAMATVLGIYTFPYLLMKDVSHLELKMRGYEIEDNTHHLDFWSLWCV